MAEENHGAEKAYRNQKFLSSPEARELRLLAEYIEPRARFEAHDVSDTIVFFGSARAVPRDEAIRRLEAAQNGDGDLAKAENDLRMSRYYEDARALAGRLTLWSKGLKGGKRRFIVCTGGGPGIMEAANRGASEAGGINVGLNISLPMEQHENPYITRELNFDFHYFFMRKFWFIYLAKALVVFPGGFGTLDEFFESLTLVQTGKLNKVMPIILFGKAFWEAALKFDVLIEHGTIAANDRELFFATDSVDEAYDHIVEQLTRHGIDVPGGML